MGKMLSWMQDREAPVFTIATANDVTGLRQELLRKGRFDEIFFLDLHNEIERNSIFHYHIHKRTSLPRLSYIDFFKEGDILKNTLGWSGAEIEQVIIQSLRKIENIYSTDDDL